MVAYITELNEKNYDSFVEKGIVLVDIKTNWCGPCKVLSPIVDEVSSDYFGQISVGKLDADTSREIITKLGVRNIPTLILYKDGEIVEKNVGMITKEGIKDLIDNHLS
jgi:thioredoxin 1